MARLIGLGPTSRELPCTGAAGACFTGALSIGLAGESLLNGDGSRGSTFFGSGLTCFSTFGFGLGFGFGLTGSGFTIAFGGGSTIGSGSGSGSGSTCGGSGSAGAGGGGSAIAAVLTIMTLIGASSGFGSSTTSFTEA